MRKQLFIGLAVEGNTDMRFLQSVVRRSFEHVVFEECDQEVDIDIFPLKVNKIGKSFPEFVAEAAKQGLKIYGVLTIAIHTDSDRDTLDERMADKFYPVFDYLKALPDAECCKVITPVIPMRMLEAWMMADPNLLIDEIGTDLTVAQLGLNRAPESVADPKSLINRAIALAQEDMPKKRRNLRIGDLYEIIGDMIDLRSLERLSSYSAFKEAIRTSLRAIGYLK